MTRNLWLVALLVVIVVVFQMSKAPSSSTTSTPGADLGVPQPPAVVTATTPASEKSLKTQTMNNATMHHVEDSAKLITLGTITHSGELKVLNMSSLSKKQGTGQWCGRYDVKIMRGDQKITGLYKYLEPSSDYKKFKFVKSNIPAGLMVNAGDSVVLALMSSSNQCSIWIKDIVVDIGVFA